MERPKTIRPGENELYVVLPVAALELIQKGQERIIALLEGKTATTRIPGGYITEAEAQELLRRKATWFWERRQRGELPFTKVGNRTYYAMADIEKFMANNRKGGGQ